MERRKIMPEFHAEPYLYLAGLTHKAALIAWGGFYFRVRDQKLDGDFKLVDDGDLKHVHPPRRETVGASSEPYGDARVEVFDSSGKLAAFAETTTANHVWISGLSPDTQYTYKVIVNGDEWGAGERRDWMAGPGGQGLRRSGRTYDNRFRTHPDPQQAASLTFAALGDFGTGVRKPSETGRRQREVAASLEQAVNERDVRLILTTGDNIYAQKTLFGVIPTGGTGDEDDDWFFTFYQPYRYIINRIPVYPAVGNHDSSETEASDDRQQLLDNFYINERFSGEEASGRASIGPGLFYRFNYGADIEFVCIDTSRQSALFGDRFFAHPNHVSFVESALPDAAAGDVPAKWRIPFSHHPPFCAGPQHSNSKSSIAKIVPLLKRAGVRAHFSGHEHNFQHSQADGIHYFVTGGGGKVRSESPSKFSEAHTTSWAAKAHFLIVDVGSDKMTVTPTAETGDDGALKILERSTPAGGTDKAPIVIERGKDKGVGSAG
jgi:tartrate-resistant acid phosphatase type 5